MPQPSKAKLKRKRLGLSDKLVDPAVSEAKRKGAAARWAKEGKTVTTPTNRTKSGAVTAAMAAYDDRTLIRHLLRKQAEARYAVLSSAVADSHTMFEIIKKIALDRNESGDTRIKAAKFILDLTGITDRGFVKDEPPLRDPSEMTSAELAEIAADLKRQIEERKAALRIARRDP